jgi:hypothetical protein
VSYEDYCREEQIWAESVAIEQRARAARAQADARGPNRFGGLTLSAEPERVAVHCRETELTACSQPIGNTVALFPAITPLAR